MVEVVVGEIGAENSGIQDGSQQSSGFQDGSQQSSGFQDGSQQSSGFQDGLYGTNFGVPIVLEDVVGNTGFEDQSFENSWIEDERFENTGLGEDETTGTIAAEDSEIFYQNFAIRDFLKTFFFLIFIKPLYTLKMLKDAEQKRLLTFNIGEVLKKRHVRFTTVSFEP